MSQLRAPAARADRREGGRHGRPVDRNAPALPEAHVRPQLLRLAVLPPVAVALAAAAAVLFMARSTGVRPGLTLSAVLAGAVSVTLAAVAIAAVAADRAARSVRDRVDALRSGSVRGEADLRTLLDALRQGEAPPRRKARGGGPPSDADDFELLAADLAREREGAVTAVVQAARLSTRAGHEQKVEVFVNLARRLQSLVHREIAILDELENRIEDPDLLKGLFHVDHLATRIRRHAENLAVLGGAVSRRQWSNPVPMTEVLRSAIAEVEQYSRVKLVPPLDGTLRGHAVADVMHLLAELVENATVFSAPNTQVLLRANVVTAGLAVEVEDRGLGMPVDEQHSMNQLLADPDQVNVAGLLADGRIGLYVVSQLARRHGINVRLQSNIYGGVQAVLVLPPAVLGAGVPDGAAAAPAVGADDSPAALPPAAPALQRGSAVPQLPPAAADRGTGEDRLAPPRRTAPAAAAPPSRPAAAPPAERGPATAPAAPAASAPHGGEPFPASRDGAAPAPLPRRNSQEGRHNPADAVPGIRPDDRAAVAERAGEAPVPRAEALRGTMHRPHLPRRRALEHLAPQLLEAPAPRPDDDVPALHDPGLVAAFRRGVGLAETQQDLERAETEAEAPAAAPEPLPVRVPEAPRPPAAVRDSDVRGRDAVEEAPEPPAPVPVAAHPLDAPGGSALAALRAGRPWRSNLQHLPGSSRPSVPVPGEPPTVQAPVSASVPAEAYDGRGPAAYRAGTGRGEPAPAAPESAVRPERAARPDADARSDGSTPAG
ncbi:ATP-binding protein [Streptomyces sp. NPDC008150]|uniref:ATP-binding protein n=1 Tax=Streptomyces sp. NPDC008150 TaxID=3364816 RepID=UPI0036E75278